MRKFSSYGPIDTSLYYYAPRQTLVGQALANLVGEDPMRGGHYITVWAPRQRGKTWIMQQVLFRLQSDPQFAMFDVLKLGLEYLKTEQDADRIAQSVTEKVCKALDLPAVAVSRIEELDRLFERGVLRKPLILMLDEFDALTEEAISGITGIFRHIYSNRQDEGSRPTAEKTYLLHAVALIGVRAVLGVENPRGSPFNVQRSLHVPNLTFEEVQGLFEWYTRESGQLIGPAVVERLFYETRGQPGLTCWFGELLTETYNRDPTQPIGMAEFEHVYIAASHVLPNNNILNILSKARQEQYKGYVLEMFRTDERVVFKYDDPVLNYLYLNGVVDWEWESAAVPQVKFPCPFVQKRLFSHFAGELFRETGRLYDPFEDLSDTISDDRLDVRNLLRRYERYLQQNRSWLLKDAPRRADLRIYEAVYHFNLFTYLFRFLQRRAAEVYPEFPTGNGKVDIFIKYADQVYGLEVKSFTDEFEYRAALQQAATYGRQLGLTEITLAFFVERVDKASRQKYEMIYVDPATGVTVTPVFVETG
ncbi:MAG: ATP-binding protein [Chloroflexi bacterium]|nr:ATP-binding protein [Chloroflexota bacterium]